MKKLLFVLFTFIFIFSFSCGSSPANINDLKKTYEAEVPEMIEVKPLPSHEFTEPQILQDAEITVTEDYASSVFEEFTGPEIFNEIVITEDEHESVIIEDSLSAAQLSEPVTIEDDISVTQLPEPVIINDNILIAQLPEPVIIDDNILTAQLPEPVIIEDNILIAQLPEPVIVEDSISVTQLPEPVIAVIETPPEKKEQEAPASSEVQIKPQAVSVPQPVIPQIPARPAQENAPQAPVSIIEEKPLQTAGNPAEEKPPVSESSPSVPTVVSALRNEPVIPPQTLPVIPPNGEIIYSRTVRATAGQTIEIPFHGTGWVYQGELASRRGISYDSRRLDPDGQSFIFRAAEAGTYSLKFFKEDFIRDYIINDHVMVIVSEAPQANSGWFNSPQDRGRVTAQPRWPAALDEAEMRRSGVSAGANNADTPSGLKEADNRTVTSPQPQRQDTETRSGTSTQTQSQGQESPNRISTQERPSLSANDTPNADGVTATGTLQFSGNPDELLLKAKEAFDEGKVQTAISFLDQYKYFFPSGSDEAYWLYGQFYEANTPDRNILLALDYYKRLTNEYPQSSRYSEARRRIQYLERFYININ
jgi:hypothetical protein